MEHERTGSSSSSQHFDLPGLPGQRLSSLAAVGGVVAAGLLASACCLGPLLLGALGLGGAGLLAGLDQYRPLFTAITFALLSAGFWLAYRKREVVECDAFGCERPRARRVRRAILWITALAALGFWAYPVLAGPLFS